jgi:hypothetical protein
VRAYIKGEPYASRLAVTEERKSCSADAGAAAGRLGGAAHGLSSTSYDNFWTQFYRLLDK